jgi:phenylalanyl-tRNA synthetase alpha chain
MELYENLAKLRLHITSSEEVNLREELKKKNDADSMRLTRFLALSDQTRIEGHPIHEVAKRIFNIPEFKDFDHIQVPEIVRADQSFDLFNFPPEHPARSVSDTYFVNSEYILRTHTTIMWYYYVKSKEIQERIKNNLPLGSLSYGKVYRKDEIDRFHLNVFHQIDGWYLHPTTDKIVPPEELKNILGKIAKAVFGESTQYRFNEDTFPYTDPSVEMEIERGGKWVEVLGGGMVRPVVLEKLGVDPKQYTGWAFGFGAERLAIVSMELPDIRLLRSEDPRVTKQLVLDNKYKEVSKFPPITRDISFVVGKDFFVNQYYDVMRDIGGDLIEEVQLLDKYEDEKKFGPNRVSYTFRAVYRAGDRTLVSEEVDKIQDALYKETASQFGAELR